MMSPKVSVCITAYNHALFIEKCVQSVLDQKTSFEFEILIGEDGSSDSTREIIQQLEQKHSNIRAFYHDRTNIFYFNGSPTGQNNNLNNLRNARGKYIAMMDGDDYWTNPNKLQIQVDFLESHPESAGCFHNSILVDANGVVTNQQYFKSESNTFNQADAFKSLRSSYHTSSLVFRKKVVEEMPDWFLKRAADYSLDILITEFGTLNYLDFNMSAYRIHGGGVWSGKKTAVNYMELILRFEILYRVPKFRREFGAFIKSEIIHFAHDAAWLFHKEKDYKSARKAYRKYLKYKRPVKRMEIIIFVRKFLLKN